MNDIRIEPWDHLVPSDSPDVPRNPVVPPEVENVARRVAEFYDMQVNEMNLISAKPAKGGALWKLTTSRGTRSMELMHRSPRESLSIIYAQEYLSERRARVPSLIPTKNGEKYVESGGKLWIVTEWIEPLEPVSCTNLEEAQAICADLGEFHRLSKGYNPPSEYALYSLLDKWPKDYEMSIEDFRKCRQLLELHPEFDSGRRLLSRIDRFEEQAQNTLRLLKQSPYDNIVAMGEPFWGLVHQYDDWSKLNAQAGPGGVWFIDLSCVASDLPIRDLRKLISNTMVERGEWDAAWIAGMIEAYHRTNPLDRETFEMLLLDLSFPNEIYRNVKAIVAGTESTINPELDIVLDRTLALESSKEKALSELRIDSTLYPGGYWNVLERNAAESVSHPSPETAASIEDEELVWKQFIGLELDKFQQEASNESSRLAVAPEVLQFALRHASSNLIARLNNAGGQGEHEEKPLTKSMPDQRMHDFDSFAEAEKSAPAETVTPPAEETDLSAVSVSPRTEGTAEIQYTASSNDSEAEIWNQFVQDELSKIQSQETETELSETQPREADKSVISTMAPDLFEFALRHLSLYLLSRYKKNRQTEGPTASVASEMEHDQDTESDKVTDHPSVLYAGEVQLPERINGSADTPMAVTRPQSRQKSSAVKRNSKSRSRSKARSTKLAIRSANASEKSDHAHRIQRDAVKSAVKKAVKKEIVKRIKFQLSRQNSAAASVYIKKQAQADRVNERNKF